MSDLNDDLLNYELGDDIDDQALYGADEDELLLSDDELEKDVTNEVKQKLKAEAEQWVQSQIQDHQLNEEGCSATSNANIDDPSAQSEVVKGSIEVTSSAASAATMETTDTAVSTSEDFPLQNQYVEVKQPPSEQEQFQLPLQELQDQNHQISLYTDEVTSSSSKELEAEHSSMISCSTGGQTDSSFIQSSHESITDATVISDGLHDACDDVDDEREERTNIKVTSERDMAQMVGLSPDKNHQRFVHMKRASNALLRSSGPHLMRGGPYPGLRPLLRYPPHGNFPLIGHYRHMQPLPLPLPQPPLLPSDILTSIPSTKSTSSLIPGQFPTQQQSPHPFVTHPARAPGSIGLNTASPPHSQQQHNLNTQNLPHLHDPNNLAHHPPPLKPRHSFPSYRPGGPGGFRPGPGPGAGMYPSGRREYSPGSSAPQFNQNYGVVHLPRPPMYRPELPNAPCIRLGMRMQRPPHGIPMNPRPFSNSPHMRPQHPPSLQIAPANVSVDGIAPIVSTTAQPAAQPGASSMQAASVRPSKVLINPNFKGGVEAATSKFIKETQFMSTISNHVSHLQSDEELLRQQEEFINKNRQHIEKRRNERSPLTAVRRSRSRSRSHSRERSYSPKRSGSGIERHFERDRERERERDRVANAGGVGTGGNAERFVDRDRERDRERGVNHDRPGRAVSRDRERERDRPTGYGSTGGGGGNRVNRFRRGSSRDRDYEGRGGAVNHAKRRRSLSPLPIRGGRRGGDRDRNDVEEDDETRAYRLEIEKQKTLREKLLRDKEMRRRRAAEVKLNEDKPTTQSGTTNEDQPQKLKPIIVTESKIISLKKKQQRYNEDNSDRHPIKQQQPQRKHIPTAKILPEAKRTLSEHLTNASAAGSGVIHSNTAIIKPVLKQDTLSSTPPTTAVVAPTAPAMSSKYKHNLSSPSDDEVELDYDEDELMLEEEDRLLASPSPPPQQQQKSRTRTPTPESIKAPSIKSNNYNSSSSNTGGSRSHQSMQKPLTTANRRVVLKSSTSGSRREDGSSNNSSSSSRSRHGGGSHRDNHSRDGGSSNSHSKGIFERLDVRSKMNEASSNKSHRKSQQHRIVMKNN